MKKIISSIVTIFLFSISFCLLYGDSVSKSDNCDFSAEENAFMEILKKDTRQQRKNISCNPILLKIARERAKDMAVRKYFSHTNPDGDGPNILLQRAGYNLPEWWGKTRDANYIESINAGSGTAVDTYNSWMNSSGHKKHVLGEIDFYASQTVVAVGHYHDPQSQYRHYWVFLSAPPENVNKQ